MKKTLLLTFLAFAFTLFTEAQTTAQQRINDIKRQADRYVYADVTMPLQSDAVLMAKRQLGLVLEEWLRSEGYRKVRPDLATAIARQSETITTPRADMIRVFAYMEKERVERMVKKPSLLTALAPEHADALSGHQASTDSVAPSGLVAVEDTTLSEEVVVEGSEAPVESVDGTETVDSPADRAVSDALRRILAVNSFFDLKAIIVPLKEQGVIEDYGKYETMSDPERCYLIVYDPNGQVVAVLAPDGKERMNMKTEKLDNEHNYSGCGAIWVLFRE